MALLASISDCLLTVNFGTQWPLVALGTSCLAISAWLRFHIQQQASNRCLGGLPELAPARYPQRLLTEGPYARIRHPRYVQFMLALLGYALIANYLAIYAVVLVWLAGLYGIVVLEEKELRARFGEEYIEYARRVPRFIPRIRREPAIEKRRP